MTTPFATIGRAFLDSGATQTDDLIARGAKGSFFQDTRFNPKKKKPLVEPEAQAAQPPVEPPTSNQVKPKGEKPEDVVKQAKAITKEHEVEPGLPSAKDPQARNINFDNVTSSDEVLNVIDNIGNQNDQFVSARGGVVTHKQTLADSAKVELEQIIGFKVGDGVTPARITGARIALQQSADTLKTMASKVLNGAASTAEKLMFRQAVSTHVGIQQSVAGMASESGRSLNAFRIPIGVNSGSKTAVFRTQLQEAFERSGGDDAVRGLAQLIEEADDLAQVSKVASKTHAATKSDMFLETWINGLLSGPTTHVVNTTSNAMVALWSVPERLLASGVSKLLRTKDGIQAQEALGQLYGIVYGMRDGIKMFGRAIKTGEPTDPAMKLEARKYKTITAENVNKLLPVNRQMNKDGYVAKGVDLLGSAIRIPGRFLSAEDEFFKSVGYRMELNALAYRKATAEGLEGNDLAKRVIDLIENPSEEIHLASSDMARLQTFTNTLGEAGRQVQQLANTHPALKLLLPFVRTPVNIVKYVSHRTPFNKAMWQEIEAGGVRRDAAIAKMSLGSTVMMIGATMAVDGTTTGQGPKNTAVRNAMRRQGWQPYSIKIGDKWYSFNRSDPIGMFLGLSADVTETMKYAKEKDAAELAMAASLAMAKNLTSRTYLRGLSEVMNVIGDPDRFGKRFFRRQGATFVPFTSLVAGIEREIDPTLRETYSLMDQIRSRTPGLSDSLHPRRNLWGEPIVLQGGLGIDFISPVYSSTAKFDFVDNQIVENEINITRPKRKLLQGNFAIELSPDEYDRYALLAGKEFKTDFKHPKTGLKKKLGLKSYLKETMKTDMYLDATEGPDGGRSVIVKSVVSAFRDGAKGQLFREFPALQEEYFYQMQLKQEAKTGVKF